MNHWESFGCFFRSIQPLPSPYHFKKRRSSTSDLFFLPKKKNGQSGYIFYQTLRPTLLGLQIHTIWQWGCFFWFKRSGTANVLMTFFTPRKKKGKMRTVFRNIFIDIKKVIQQLQNKRKTSHLHERSNLTKCEAQKFPILTVKGKKTNKIHKLQKINKICQPWHKVHQEKKNTQKKKKKFINCQVCQKKSSHLPPPQPPGNPPPIQSTGGTSWALMASEISSNEATGGRTAWWFRLSVRLTSPGEDMNVSESWCVFFC